MRYEVTFGGFSHWCEAGSQFQACLLALREAAEQTGPDKIMPSGPMLVTNMESGEEEVIPFSEIMALQYAANNGEQVPTLQTVPACVNRITQRQPVSGWKNYLNN